MHVLPPYKSNHRITDDVGRPLSSVQIKHQQTSVSDWYGGSRWANGRGRSIGKHIESLFDKTDACVADVR